VEICAANTNTTKRILAQPDWERKRMGSKGKIGRREEAARLRHLVKREILFPI